MRTCFFSFLASMLCGALAVSNPAGADDEKQSAMSPSPYVALPTVTVDERRALGKAGATLAIVEFSDYQCPYCARFDKSTLPRIVAEYLKTGALRYFHKDLPLPMHAQAMPASVVARCASVQGKFWGVHRRLYDGQQQLSEEFYRTLIGEFGLDRNRFEGCRNDPATRRAINRDITEAQRLGINATPSFVLGPIRKGAVIAQRIAKGALSFEDLQREIEAVRQLNKDASVPKQPAAVAPAAPR